jgi:hypothetical protein
VKKAFLLFLTASSLQALQPIDVAVQDQNTASSALTPREKQYLLNSALATYLEHAQDNPSGMLLSNIGSIYFSMGDLGTAVAYYRQAHTLLPRNELIQQNLATAVSQAGVKHLQQKRPIRDFFGLQWYSPFERSAISLGAIAFSFIFFSFSLWFSFFGFLLIWRIAAFCALLILSSQAWFTLFVPQQAVVLHATPLRPSPEAFPGEIGLPTIRAGEAVEILSALPDATQVLTASEAVGFIPKDDIYFLSLQ